MQQLGQISQTWFWAEEGDPILSGGDRCEKVFRGFLRGQRVGAGVMDFLKEGVHEGTFQGDNND